LLKAGSAYPKGNVLRDEVDNTPVILCCTIVGYCDEMGGNIRKLDVRGIGITMKIYKQTEKPKSRGKPYYYY